MSDQCCVRCGDSLSTFEIQVGSDECIITDAMRVADPKCISGCEKDLNSAIVISDKPPTPKV